MMKNAKPSLSLLVSLLMFPQIIETIYSPALTDITRHFSVSAADGGQTLSIYFIAFALGVVFWGRLCDVLSRRAAMLGGLLCYAAGVFLAVYAEDFALFMVARALAAFGAAVGSIVTQTVLRDSFTGSALGKVYAHMGIAIAISPVIGFLAGGLLTAWSGYQAVLWLLCMLALALLCWSGISLPETRPATRHQESLWQSLAKLATDGQLWGHAALVALFNIILFSYYSLAPFLFQQLGLSTQVFGYSGLLLGGAAFIGGLINKRIVAKGTAHRKVVWLGILSSAMGAVGVIALQGTLAFLIPVVLVVAGFGLVIPNVLSVALKNYQPIVGTAGAWLGLQYYLMIGVGLWLASISQNYGLTLIVCVVLAILVQSRLKTDDNI